MTKFRTWWRQHLTQDEIEEVTARDVGQTWAYLVKMVKDIRRLLRPIRWVVIILVVLVLGLVWRVELARSNGDKAIAASNRAAAASQAAEIASREAEAAAHQTELVLQEAIRLVNEPNPPNPRLEEVFSKVDDIHDRCVVRKEC